MAAIFIDEDHLTKNDAIDILYFKWLIKLLCSAREMIIHTLHALIVSDKKFIFN